MQRAAPRGLARRATELTVLANPEKLYKYTELVICTVLGLLMYRLVCPTCHVPLSLADLGHVTFDDHAELICPECLMVLCREDVLPAAVVVAEVADARAF